MRPISIELEGFFAYRKRATLDLSGVDYFSLEGPTGSGKSSLIDAMILALYGKIPRLGGTTVAPAISAGAERARVSFEFIVGDTPYTATRQLERTATGGARATEVRLESGDTVLASGAAEVTSAVTGILNLSYEDFTRTVVLPQGDFARFLTSTPRDRQELLRGLLGLDVYREMATLARTREQLASSRMRSAASRLEELAVPDDEEQKAAIARLEAIVELTERVEEHEKTIVSLAARVSDAGSRLESAVDAGERLLRLTAPPRLDELSGLLAKLDDDLETRTDALARMETDRLEVGNELAALPDLKALDRHSDLYGRLEVVEADLGSIELPTAREAVRSAEAAVVVSGKARDAAAAELESIREEHAAHALARTLVEGEPCPVCRQGVVTIPATSSPVALDSVERRLAEAEETLEAGRESVAALSTDLTRAETASERLIKTRDQLQADLVDAPAKSDIPDLRKTVEKAALRLADIEEGIASARKGLGGMEEERSRLAEEQRSLGRMLMTEREKLADLHPPIAESEDVLIQWKELLSWRQVTIEEVSASIGAMQSESESLKTELHEATQSLEKELADVGIDLEGAPSVAVARAEEKARQTVREHEAAREQAERLRAEASEAGERAAVAEALARHLRADGFERWMMVGAIADLVAGANTILDELSESSYSLHSDDVGSFDIVDHRNADEIRPVATLSGGETFLVSLALALSLAETLSAGGGSNLDAIILDEGFGTLDEESLDVVATVLENLTLSGLMVGIITHVKGLAARAPVRFVVRKGPEGSHVEGNE